MKNRIPENLDLTDFYGSFVDTPDQFILLPGHVKLIEEVVSFIKHKTSLEGPDFFVFKSKLNTNEIKRAPRQGKLRKFS